jgi:hypothetical protein
MNLNDDLNRLERIQQLFKYLENEQNNQQEYDRYHVTAKRAKAIVKGDPREFMG